MIGEFKLYLKLIVGPHQVHYRVKSGFNGLNQIVNLFFNSEFLIGIRVPP